ncbi:predicted protein [Lichtheimia corymbifera JMRC:FSU:9682]|uniref:Uncharacterized protein n=1 Tax=Lichtheimia corymbifera JMRC:FSU:9682 TaxID=1263082 RepID=A0A068S7P2_9FUNG|nr:predicted protein [Lichtheimia corymbifera JMRC:FSU:9682]
MKRDVFIKTNLICMSKSILCESFKFVVGNLEVMGRPPYVYSHPFIVRRSHVIYRNEACDFNMNGVGQHVEAHGPDQVSRWR